MKTMNKISQRLMKTVGNIQMFLEMFLTLLGLSLLWYPQGTLERMQEVIADSTMTDSLKVFPLLWVALSLVQMLRRCRKIFLKICKR